ncbi:MAG: amino acid ABC transporter ATP-binding protein [Candidatus Accumulibacter sp.]|nr:amino acid ABC transporter ATP-binding protein [Accumulibacter sp.]
MLSVTGLRKSFGDNLVLDDISFDLQECQVLTFIGASGCGKSTLLRAINGLETIDSGEIRFDGKTLDANTDWRRVRTQIGMVFQSYELFNHLSVLDNVTLAPIRVQKKEKQDAEELAIKLLTRVGLTDKVNAFPRQLSGGQKQRVAIARALAMQPRIMLFDEITASLDPEMSQEVCHTLLELAETKMTMIVVTHEMGFAQAIGDELIFLDEGRIVERGDPHAFFAAPQTERARRFLKRFEFHKGNRK